MSWRWVQTPLAVIAGIGFCLYALTWVDLGRSAPIDGVRFVEQVTYCADRACTAPQVTPLPFVTSFRYDPGIERHEMRVVLEFAAPPAQVQALYLPKYSDHLEVFLNGRLIHADPAARRPWNAPLLVPVSPDLVQAGANNLKLVLSGDVPGRLDLHPFHFGDRERLVQAYSNRFALGPGVTRFVFALMLLLSLGYLIVWQGRRHARMYLWMGLSCLSASVFLGMLSLTPPITSYRIWTFVQSCGLAGYAFFMLKFIRLLLGLHALKSERIVAVAALGGLVALCIVPMQWVNLSSSVVYLASIWAGIVVVAVMWEKGDTLPRVDFHLFFPALSLALAFAFDSFAQKLLEETPRSLHLLHLMPLLTALVCLWLILSQLSRSLHQQEAMTRSLNATVAEKSRQLEESYAAIAKVQHAQAVQAERGRILLELHDGVGGQLVNTLAYLESRGLDDPTLREALESALRDLALMLDSLETHDSLVTLLGMLRTRLEGLLGRHGVMFDWQIMEEPELPVDGGPSLRLHIARIVQEAITNVIKHADASVVTVYADRHQVVVRDNGKGFDVSAAMQSCGYGLAGMQRRAENAGAALTIVSDETGTKISVFPVMASRKRLHAI